MVDMRFSRGIEEVIALAALDAHFHRRLIQDRKAAIDSCDIELTESERMVLLAIPNPQLDEAINKVPVPKEARRQFLRGAVIAAIALVLGTCLLLPSAVSMGMRADSAAAISTLRTISSAQELYKTRHNRYAPTLKDLVDVKFVDESMSSGRKSRYIFLLSNAREDSFEIRAIPVGEDKQYFYMNEKGEIHYSDGPEVGPESRKLGE